MGKLGLLFLVWSGIEIGVMVWIGQHWGGWVLVALLVLPVLLGRQLIRGQSLAGVQSLAGQRETPTAAILRVLAGVLLIVPGFVTDILALLCLWPATGRWVQRNIAAAMGRANPRGFGAQGGQVFEGEVVREPPSHQLPPRQP